MTKLRGANGYIMGDFNIDLIKMGTHGPTSDFIEGVTSVGFYPLISLPTRLTDNTATLIDNILTSNLEERLEIGVVMVRILDHLPVLAFVGGEGWGPKGWEDKGTQRRVVTGARLGQFSRRLEEWDWRGESHGSGGELCALWE